MKPFATIALSLLLSVALTGCVERMIRIDTEPSGATVWLNDQELGSTPLQTEFLFYGDYDIVIRKEECETLRTHRRTPRPFYQYLGIDLIAEVLIPFTFHDTHTWQFELKPLDTTKQALLDRALQSARTASPSAPAVPDPNTVQ